MVDRAGRVAGLVEEHEVTWTGLDPALTSQRVELLVCSTRKMPAEVMVDVLGQPRAVESCRRGTAPDLPVTDEVPGIVRRCLAERDGQGQSHRRVSGASWPGPDRHIIGPAWLQSAHGDQGDPAERPYLPDCPSVPGHPDPVACCSGRTVPVGCEPCVGLLGNMQVPGSRNC